MELASASPAGAPAPAARTASSVSLSMGSVLQQQQQQQQQQDGAPAAALLAPLADGDTISISSSSAQTFDPNQAVSMATLENILNKPAAMVQFQHYLRENLAEETFEFVKQVRHLLAAAATNDISCEYIRAEAHDIYNKFLAPDAIMEVNLTCRCRKTLSESIHRMKVSDFTCNWVRATFHRAEHEVLKLMQGKLYGFLADIDKPVLNEVMDTVTKPGQKRVVIVGGGFAGFLIAYELDNNPRFHVTLIDKKEYIEYTPSMVKAVVRELPNPIQCPHHTYIKNGRVILGYATSVQKDHVVVNNKKIPFDYLAICSGSTYTTNLKSEALTTNFTTKQSAFERKELETAKTCLVIGGGFVGVELACEIKAVYPEKEVYLIEANKNVMKRCTPSIIKKTTDYMQKLGVRVILNERVVDLDPHKREFTTSYGFKIIADKVYIATGPVPHSSFLKDGPFKEKLDSSGRVKVGMTLQVEGCENVFAAGDVCNTPDEKMARNAAMGGYVIARNIVRLEKGKKALEMGKKYMPNTLTAPSYLFLSLGNKDAMYVAHMKYGFINTQTLKIKDHYENTYMGVFFGRKKLPDYVFGRQPDALQQIPGADAKPLILAEELGAASSTSTTSLPTSSSTIGLASLAGTSKESLKDSTRDAKEAAAAVYERGDQPSLVVSLTAA